MEDLSLHVLDVVENSIRAGASRVDVRLHEEENWLVLRIADDGQGMSQDEAERAADPFFTSSAAKQVGLGLAFLEQSARETGGRLEIDSEPGEGTEVRAFFKPDHPDMKPLGDLEESVRVLDLGNPGVRLNCEAVTDEMSFRYESD